MKKLSYFILVLGVLFSCYGLYAEEVVGTTEGEAVTPAVESAAPAEEAVNEITTENIEADAENTGENLEFVSGEISGVDEANKTATVKVYGETEDEASQKTLTVQLDETTDITDGENDRDLKSLAAGTEVDVEYDPATSKATYIFVY